VIQKEKKYRIDSIIGNVECKDNKPLVKADITEI
jgi:hypothetical protein